jgi:hypothetical protein
MSNGYKVRGTMGSGEVYYIYDGCVFDRLPVAKFNCDDCNKHIPHITFEIVDAVTLEAIK